MKVHIIKIKKKKKVEDRNEILKSIKRWWVQKIRSSPSKEFIYIVQRRNIEILRVPLFNICI